MTKRTVAATRVAFTYTSEQLGIIAHLIERDPLVTRMAANNLDLMIETLRDALNERAEQKQSGHEEASRE